jgi:hypothetical protein
LSARLLWIATAGFAVLSGFGWWVHARGPDDAGGLEIAIGAGGLALVAAAGAIVLQRRDHRR